MSNPESADYSERVPAKGPHPKTPPARKALPGHSKQDKHPVVKRGESFDHQDLIGKWSAR